MNESEIKQRNEEKLAAAIAYLGDKYVLHPKNSPTKRKFKALVRRSSQQLKGTINHA